jgi:ABC-type nickel/cobalt efflux system permease component RcnA
MRAGSRIAAAITAGVLSVPLFATAAHAHPLGNFTVNRFTGVTVRAESVAVDVVVDTAEIPAYQRRADIDRDGNKRIDTVEKDLFSAAECSREINRLRLDVDGRRAELAVRSAALEFPPGQAGLDTMRLSCTADDRVSIASRGSRISIADTAADSRLGWREVVAAGDGMTLSGSSVPATSVSNRLTSYPKDLLSSPLDVRNATMTARPGGAPLAGTAVASPATPLSRGIDGATAAFSRFVGRRHLTPPVVVVAFLLALGLGAIHALAPGHGKTVMAAFLVGERGSLRQAWLIGLTVTVTHTAGVLVLGVVLTATDLAAPQRVFGLLGLASGLLLAAVGAMLLVRALRQRHLARQRDAHQHVAVSANARRELVLTAAAPAAPVHDHPHPHAHGDGHSHGHPHAANVAAEDGRHSHGPFSHTHVVPDAERPLGWRSIVAMGFAGGLVPSPSALVVLLGAVALGRAWFGVVLVLAYGAGMAITLTGTGLALSRARDRLGARTAFGPRAQRVMRVARLLPLGSAVVILSVGTVIAAQGLRAAL